MRSGGYLGNLFEKFDILRMLAELVVADQRTKRLAAENAEFIFIHFLEHHALIEFRSALKVAQQLFLAYIEYADLEHRTGFALIHHVFNAAPTGFQLLKRRMMKDFVQLQRNKMVDLRHTGIDRGISVARELHLAFENLCHELLHHVSAALARNLLFAKPPLLDDLIQQARVGCLCARRLSGRLLRLTHQSLPWACPSRSLSSTGLLSE